MLENNKVPVTCRHLGSYQRKIESKTVCLRTDIGMAGTETIFCLHQRTRKGPWGKVLPTVSTQIIV